VDDDRVETDADPVDLSDDSVEMNEGRVAKTHDRGHLAADIVRLAVARVGLAAYRCRSSACSGRSVPVLCGLSLDLVLETVVLCVEADTLVHLDLCLVRLAADLGRLNLWAVVVTQDLVAFDEAQREGDEGRDEDELVRIQGNEVVGRSTKVGRELNVARGKSNIALGQGNMARGKRNIALGQRNMARRQGHTVRCLETEAGCRVPVVGGRRSAAGRHAASSSGS
jgi:hypothetical protein